MFSDYVNNLQPKKTAQQKSQGQLQNVKDKITPSKELVVKGYTSPKNAKNFVHPFRDLVFNPQISEEKFKKHYNFVKENIKYARKLIKPPEEALQPFKIELHPTKDHQGRVLFLDLDETLIHSNDTPTAMTEEYIKIKFSIRPHFKNFLQKVGELYDIYIFTAAFQDYATEICKILDPKGKYIKGIFHRLHCMQTKNGASCIKDLRIFSGIDLSKTLFVDNLVVSFAFQLDNGIPIMEWIDDKQDQELKYLANYLEQAAQYNDLRAFNMKSLNLSQLGLEAANDTKKQ